MLKRMAAILVAGAAIAPQPGLAQSGIDGRVGRLESEMRAVQRKVFPGGAGTTLQPEITAPPPSAEAPGMPATSALADLNGRVASLEQQITSLTGQIEQAGYRTRQLQDQFDAYKRDTDARIKTLEGSGAGAPVPVAGAPVDEAAEPPSKSAPSRPAARTASPRPAEPAAEEEETPAAATPTAAIDKPQTGDPAEDGYLAGYRLWQAKRYPEAEAQLKKVVATYPKSRRASFAQNLLGRAYLDEGKPSLASMAFYDNYKKMPDGERAPDSLYYLAQALVTLKKPADACKVYDELNDVYGAKISQSMKADVAKGRTTANCK